MRTAMNKPREINPECIDDDAWWDIEALKLAVIDPGTFRRYGQEAARNLIDGSNGLISLGFVEDPGNKYIYIDRVDNFGAKLINACKRVSQCK